MGGRVVESYEVDFSLAVLESGTVMAFGCNAGAADLAGDSGNG